MNCKNCQTPQRTDYKYCPACGAKVVVHRLTFRNLTYDITERYFNLDNTFIQTLVQLLLHPEQVIDAYVQGVRRKYLNPISHLGIALTLSGISIFIMQKTLDPEVFMAYGGQLPKETAVKLYDAIYDFSTLFFILYIPVFALAGYLTFNRKNYLLSEYLIAYIYIMAQWSILSFPFTVTTLIISAESYLTLSWIMLFAMVAYCIFSMQRIHRYKAGGLVLRTSLFFALAVIGYFMIVILFYIVMFLTGTLEIQDFAPKQ
ncbi:Protein of unknown function [Muriicola jejuensis]|uniref:DUF3667 domain-containing protein n=1 Tax=Muriicola jejuensis TaxID=504488 RepID=A0A6P0UC69_9FLAO|nr:DUF3667 domain-containing protein [Muriicola jejuensis]NER10637.1 DUF3667 domain-containing protein [Muriicola jejuensis]SMP17340.1 Protein of unknown function [Muriicola jejuensis]